MAIVELVLLLVALCLGFAVVARRLAVPYAVILVVGGMALALLPGLPDIELDPELALAFFLPPLLQASAFRTDLRAFRDNLRPILLLAVGAVLFTALSVALVATWLLPDLPFAAALALGAIVAPPDAVAAAAVLQRLRLPRRIVTVLEGESLMNDASALVLYRLAVAAAAAGATLGAGGGALTFLGVGLGGVVVGGLIGFGLLWVLHRLDDPMLETSATFLGAYAAYLLAETLHVSGVMAVVTGGLILGRAQHALLTPRTRLVSTAVWQFVEFLLNSLVFILIGLQLNQILDRLVGMGVAELTGLALAISAAVILSRFLWVFPATWLPRRIPSLRRADPSPPWQHTAIVAWAGMRGVVSLAAALALPSDFPARDLIVFLAFTAILATLVVQGTTLEWLIRRLGVEEADHADGIDPEEAAARRAMSAAALAEIESRLDDPLEGAIAADIVHEYRDRAGHLHRIATTQGAAAAERSARRRLRIAALDAARDRLIADHRAGHFSAEALLRLEQELDLEETRLRAVLGDDRTPAEIAAAASRRHARSVLFAAHA